MATCLKKSKRDWPSGVYGKYVKDVVRLQYVNSGYCYDRNRKCKTYGQDMMETMAMPMMIAALTLYAMR